MKSKKNKFTKDTLIADVIKETPDAVEVFYTFGMYCAGCPASAAESIENGAKVHGLSDEKIKEMVERLNEVALYKE